MKSERNSDLIENVIILRNVYKICKGYVQPCVDPSTGVYPDCVKLVNSAGDMIMTDAERNSGKVFLPVNTVIELTDGMVFHLDNEIEKARWEAIKYAPIIANSRDERDANGNLKIDGAPAAGQNYPRYGVAEWYIERPGLEAARKVKKKDQIRKALNFIYDDDMGYEGRLLHAKLLGKEMDNMPDSDVTDFLIQIAEKSPERIINSYTGTDSALQLLFIDAKKKHVIYLKNRLYLFADDIVLGASDEAVIGWMKDPINKRTLDLIKKATYPDYFTKQSSKDEDSEKTESKTKEGK